jgi:hypothetical protein
VRSLIRLHSRPRELAEVTGVVSDGEKLLLDEEILVRDDIGAARAEGEIAGKCYARGRGGGDDTLGQRQNRSRDDGGEYECNVKATVAQIPTMVSQARAWSLPSCRLLPVAGSMERCRWRRWIAVGKVG